MDVSAKPQIAHLYECTWTGEVSDAYQQAFGPEALGYWQTEVERGRAILTEALDYPDGTIGHLVIWLDKRNNGDVHLVLGPAFGEVIRMYTLIWDDVDALAVSLGAKYVRIDCDSADYAAVIQRRYQFQHFQTQVVYPAGVPRQ